MIAGFIDAYGIITYGVYRFVHEREHHPDRLPDRGGRVRPGLALGAGDPVLRRRIVRREPCSCSPRAVLRDGRCSAWSQPRWPMIIGLTHFGLLIVGVRSIAAVSFAMGIMNSALSRVGAQSVSLTFVTGTLSRVGSHLALAAKRAPLAGRAGTVGHPSAPRAMLWRASGPGFSSARCCRARPRRASAPGFCRRRR